MRILSKLIRFVSAEWLLTHYKHPNSGTVIVIRALFTTVCIYVAVLALRNMLDPERTWEFRSDELRGQVVHTLSLFGAMFGATYAALYARFSSQWQYLANVYNQIKAVESSQTLDSRALASWKAGFLEDAEDLHLATNRVFASVLRAWGTNYDVRVQYIANTPGGQKRFDALMERVRSAYQQHEENLLSSLS